MIDRIARILVDAGAEPAAAARAAEVIDRDGSVKDAVAALEKLPEFDPLVLLERVAEGALA